MAATTDTRERALIYLNSLELMIADLAEVAAEWPQLSDLERESWRLDWGNEMGSLQLLAGYVADGALDEPDTCRYQRVLAELRAVLPTISRLNLRRPRVADISTTA